MLDGLAPACARARPLASTDRTSIPPLIPARTLKGASVESVTRFVLIADRTKRAQTLYSHYDASAA
jgi:hypothetical protein